MGIFSSWKNPICKECKSPVYFDVYVDHEDNIVSDYLGAICSNRDCGYGDGDHKIHHLVIEKE